MKCKICNNLTHFVFTKEILFKYKVAYFRCSNCGFMQTEKPYWLAEAYELPLSPLDIYLVSRPLEYSHLTESLILKYFDYKGKFLDYGGGSGVFTRMMRDRGLEFYRQDKYAQNLFAQFFDISDLLETEHNFELVTSFEVLEHLEHPLDELREVFAFSNNVLCSTGIQPSVSMEKLEFWTYIGEAHGQHISFFTRESMRIVADKFGCFYYYDEQYPTLHLFSQKIIDNFSFEEEYKNYLPYVGKEKLIKLIQRLYNWLFNHRNKPKLQSLITKDNAWVLQNLQQNRLRTKHK